MKNDLKGKDPFNLFQKYLTNSKRIEHSISTGEHMKKEAYYFGIDREKAYLAGLYHDLGKELSKKEILKYTDSFLERNLIDIPYLDFKREVPSLLHGAASAEILLREVGALDKELITAVVHHSTGGSQLSLLAKYMFIFDYCEPMRPYSESRKIYHYLIKERNLKKAYYYSYFFLLKDIIKKGKMICPESIDGYNESLQEYFTITTGQSNLAK